MKSFKQFVSKITPALIPEVPVHGGHASKKVTPDPEEFVEPTLIPVVPDHGAHSKKLSKGMKLEKFDDDDEEAANNHHWHHETKGFDPYLLHPHNEHLGKTPTEVHNKLDKYHKDFDKHPGSKHVVDYTTHSHDLNHNLLAKHTSKKKTWAPHKYDTDHDKEWKAGVKKKHYAQVAGIDRALKKSKLEHDVHVFHGTQRWHPGELAAKHPKGHIKSAAFMSTSVDPRNAHTFAGGKYDDVKSKHILHIHMKKGQHAMYVGSNSSYKHEKEMLLPRNTTLKVHPEPKVLKCGTHVWKAHVVDHHDDKD